MEVCTCKSKLNKNDKRVLKYVIKNGRSPDTVVAKDLGITSQGVVKIRNKLESLGVIKGYNPVIDYSKLGLSVLALGIIKFLPGAFDYYGEKKLIKKLQDNPHIIWSARQPTSDATHICLYGFEDYKQMEDYLYEAKSRLSKIFKVKEIYAFSSDQIIKQSEKGLLFKLIDQKNFSVSEYYSDNPSVKGKKIQL